MGKRGAAALVVVGTIGCSRIRDLPLSELPKLSAEHRQAGEPVVVTAKDGKRVLIESFSRVEVMRRDCRNEGKCYDVTEDRVDRVQSIRLDRDRIEIVGLHGRRRPQRVTHVIALEDSERWARISKRSWSRGLTIGGVAAGVGLGVGIAVGAIVGANVSDPHGLTPIVAGAWSAAAAGGATLIVTLPATRDLGTEVE